VNLRKILAFAIGPIGVAGLGFITLPILTWHYSAEDVGRLAMQQIAISFSILLFSLGLDQAFVREFHEEHDKAHLLKATMVPGLLLLVLVLALPVLAIGPAQIASLIFGQTDAALTALLFVAIVSTFFTRFLSLILRMQERGLAFSLSQVLPKALFLMLIGAQVVLAVTPTFRALLLATTISSLCVAGAYGWNTRSELRAALRAEIDLGKLRAMVAYALPLIVGGLAFWGLTAMDRMFLRATSTLDELAIYSVACNFAAGAAILQSVFGTLWAPTVYRWAVEGDCAEKVDQASEHVLFVIILLFCLSGLMSWLLPLMLPPRYAAVQYVFMASLAYPLLYTLSETTAVGIGLLRRSGFSLLASAIALLVNLAGNYWLVPRFGAAGAAVASSLAFTAFFVCRTEGSAYLWRPFPRTKMYLFVSSMVLTVIATALIGSRFQAYASVLWLVILAAALLCFRGTLRAASGFVSTVLAR
jgi:O-antigen/teichoic acid export membrane protein